MWGDLQNKGGAHETPKETINKCKYIIRQKYKHKKQYSDVCVNHQLHALVLLKNSYKSDLTVLLTTVYVYVNKCCLYCSVTKLLGYHATYNICSL